MLVAGIVVNFTIVVVANLHSQKRQRAEEAQDRDDFKTADRGDQLTGRAARGYRRGVAEERCDGAGAAETSLLKVLPLLPVGGGAAVPLPLKNAGAHRWKPGVYRCDDA